MLEKIIFLAGTYFIFLEKRSAPNLKSIQYQIEKDNGKKVKRENWEDRGSSSQIREILVPSCKLVALMLG